MGCFQFNSNSASSQKKEPVLWVWRSTASIACVVCFVSFISLDLFHVQPFTDLQEQQHLNQKVCTF